MLDSPSEQGAEPQALPATWLKFKCWISVSGTFLIGGKEEECNASFRPCRSMNLSQVADSLAHQTEARIRNEAHLSDKIPRSEEPS